jgi:hypothetical protein
MPERPRAYVWQDVEHRLWAAVVDFRDGTPFGMMDGPDRTSAETALAWAREQARQVVVTVSNERYSAGSDPVRGLPQWSGEVPDSTPDDRNETTVDSATWQIAGRVEWLREDRDAVAAALANHIEGSLLTSDVRHFVDGTKIQVSFLVEATSVLRAREMASRILRDAWRDTGVRATPGADYDLVSWSVDPVPPAG